jgi:hypothetical protein
MTICELDQDILATNVLSQAHPSDLKNFLLSCKTFYHHKREYFKENEYAKDFKWKYDSTRDYFSTMANSYITFQRYNLTIHIKPIVEKTKQIDSAKNTTRLAQYHQSKGEQTDGILRTYMLELLLNQYGYTVKKSCEQKMDAIFNTKWWKSNIDYYDFYQIVYHLSYRKYRALEECLKSITLVNENNCFHYATFASIVRILCKTRIADKKLGLIVKYVLFSYLGNIIDKICTQKYSPFFRECMIMIRQNEDTILKMKSFPKYIRQLLSDKFNNTYNLLQNRLDRMLID